ncbi:hypothetical protein P4278_27105 [Bacillus thuringiensis]|nr:hypothetical protein [Bacillus thuringiensis]MED2760323.1 hypothetical protein [Bacillus thuringiensis]MED2768511.1 hypothetical protein [Bacillus thuringiensis]MED2777787.1 hypothetical protein [Bacillus thuringiensis]MED2783323.1 hypothetical protein [Bacillus thuringiensis]
MPDHNHNGHGEGAHWTHVDIPEHYEYIQHGDHIDFGSHVSAHTGFYNASEGLQQPTGMPPQGHTPEGYHWVGIPAHYDGHGDHSHYKPATWGLHHDHN